MIQYIVEVLAFQLLFLVVYDLFLKKETFFNWNRVYLIVTSIVSLLIPFIKFSAITTAIPKQYTYVFPIFENLQEVVLAGEGSSRFNYQFQWEHLLYVGMAISLGFLLFKLYKINVLLRRGKVIPLPNYTKVLLVQSKQAFSFFKYIFLGDAIVDNEHEKIIEHELVHVRHKHSIDLLYFELLRVIFWFNPLIYVYQNRIAELHEFIADAKAVKTNKHDYVNQLLSQAFQVQHISFVNQFLQPSLLKKRLKMISRQQSKSIFKLKYLFLVPLVFGMLVYTSCEQVGLGNTEELNNEAFQISEKPLSIDNKVAKTPFAVVDQVPIFPGCENAADQRACFQEKIQAHIRKNFRYPAEAQTANIQGRVYTNFVIATDGTIQNLRMRGPDELLETEVERIINRLPQFIPGKHKGDVVNVLFSIPVTFKLNSTSAQSSNTRLTTEEEQAYVDKIKKREEELIRQSLENGSDKVAFAVIDEVPIFPGCESAADKRVCFQEKIKAHIRKNFRYPLTAQESGVQGRVYVNFVIDENGNIGSIKMRSPDNRLSAEAKRIIEKLPTLKAGRQQGKAVNVPFSIPITFKLN